MEKVRSNRVPTQAEKDRTMARRFWKEMDVNQLEKILLIARIKGDTTQDWEEFSNEEQLKIVDAIDWYLSPVAKTNVKRPDLLVFWNPELEYGVESNVEVYKPDEICESCGNKGCYVLRDDPNSLGLCKKHLQADTKQIVRIDELPSTHEY